MVQVAGLAAHRLDGGDGLGALVVLKVGDDHHGAFLSQPFGAAAPDPARPAGDQRDLTLDPTGHAFDSLSDRCSVFLRLA